MTLAWRRAALRAVALGSVLVLMSPHGFAQGTPPDASPVELELLVDGLQEPVDVASAPDGSGRLFVVERRGRIVALRSDTLEPTVFLDISDKVESTGLEEGLLSVAFHPRFARNGFLYIAYTPAPRQVAVARYHVSAAHPEVADPRSSRVLLNIRKGSREHSGGLVLFGPDGYLYVGLGDGVQATAADAPGNAQDTSVLLGKILRLDVHNIKRYRIPSDNPFVDDPNARPEIWAYGLRNPWRFSFDRATGDLYIGDVGLDSREEIDFQPAGVGGLNFGWNHLEGSLCRDPEGSCDDNSFTLPIFDYDRSMGGTVIGGCVYRGSSIPSLYGQYVFGDFMSGRIWAIERQAESSQWQPRALLDTGLLITSFGEDPDGEIYITEMSHGGLYRLAAAPSWPAEP